MGKLQKLVTPYKKITDPAEIKAIQDQLKTAVDAKNEFDFDAQKATARIPGIAKKEDADAATTAETARAKAMREMMEEDQKTARGMSEAYTAVFAEQYEQMRTEVERSDEAYRKASEDEHEADLRGIRDLEEKRAAMRAVTEETIRAAEADYQQATREAQYGVRMGGSSKAGAAKETNASWSKEESTTSALQEQQDALGYVPGMTGQVADQYNQIQAQITAAMKKGTAEREQIAEQEALRQQAIWNKGFQMFQSIQNEMLTSHQSAAQIRMKIEQQVSMMAIDAVEKELFKHLEVEAKKVAAYIEGKVSKKAADAADATSGHALLVAQNIGEIQSYAAVAAAAAYASTVGIPVVGLAAAPAAAAAAYTQASAYSAVAAFDTGTGFVPREGLGLLHPGEAVLPPPQTEMLGKVLDAVGNGNKGGFHATMTNHFHGANSAAPKQLMRSVQAGMLRAHALAS